MLENYLVSNDTIKKIKKIDLNLKLIFGKEIEIKLEEDAIEILKHSSRYFSDKFFQAIEKYIKLYFKKVFNSDIDLDSSYSWSKIIYNYYLFKDGDFVLKNEIKDDQKNIIPKDLILFYGIIYFPEKIKINLEKMRGN